MPPYSLTKETAGGEQAVPRMISGEVLSELAVTSPAQSFGWRAPGHRVAIDCPRPARPLRDYRVVMSAMRGVSAALAAKWRGRV
jgi:hypothetical protein